MQGKKGRQIARLRDFEVETVPDLGPVAVDALYADQIDVDHTFLLGKLQPTSRKPHALRASRRSPTEPRTGSYPSARSLPAILD